MYYETKVKRMGEKKKLDLIPLSSVLLVMTVGNSMLMPVLPLIEKQLGISSFQVSLIITVYSVVAILLIPVAGYLSDRFGRKLVKVPCLLIYGCRRWRRGWAQSKTCFKACLGRKLAALRLLFIY
jgi:ACDE family multidrug resistance protein